MDRDEFWAIVEAAREGAEEPDEVADAVRDALSLRTPEEVLAYLQHQNELLVSSYSWRLWGVAYLANGGCSDDGFDYFRGWLLTRGREAFERVVANPDQLVDLVEAGEEAECEDMLAAPTDAYRLLTGRYPERKQTSRPPLGAGWDFDDPDEMQLRYPRCFAKLA
jgi:hypothetical protein